MTVRDWPSAWQRQWIVLALGFIATLLIAVEFSRGPIVYWTDTQIRLLGPMAPNPTREENALLAGGDSLTALAGVIVFLTNMGNTVPTLSSGNPTVVDVGIYKGRLIRLPNEGGQWAMNFTQPQISVQVSGSDLNDVTERTRQAVADVENALAELQNRFDVDASQRVTAYADPPTPVIAAAKGSRAIAVLASQIVGVLLTLWTALGIDSRVMQRKVDLCEGGQSLDGGKE